MAGLAATLVCGVGTYLFGQAVDARYPVAEWLVWRLAPIWGYTLLFNFSAVAFGAFLLRRLLGERELPALERLLQSMVLGLTGFILLWYGLGFVGLFKPWTAIGLPLALLLVGATDGRALARELLAWRASIAVPSALQRVLGTLAAMAGAIALCFLYLEALDVSVLNFDAVWYHYPTAQDYARLGRIVAFPGEHHRAFPHLTSMVHTWALLVPKLKYLPQHWMLSLHLEYTIVVWRIVGAAALARFLLGGRDVRGLWAGFFLFPSIFVYDQSIGGSADHFLGFFAAPVLLAAARALKNFDVRWGVLLGAALGGHLLVKYQAAYLVAGVGVAVVARLGWLLGVHAYHRVRKTSVEPVPVRRLAKGGGAILVTLLLVSAPHFAKNVAFYNNPYYPFAQKVFKSSNPKPTPGFYQEAPSTGVFSPKSSGLGRQLWAFKKVFTYSFTTANRSLTNRRPYMGSLFSLLLPCALLLSGRKRFLGIAGVLVVAFMMWANTAANDRYLLSFYDGCIGMALALMVAVWELNWLARLGLIPLVASQLIWGGDAMLFYGRKELEAGLDLIGQGYSGRYDEARFVERGAQKQITEATPKNAVILSRNYKGLLGLNRTVISDIRAASHYTSYSGLKEPRDFYDMLKARGVTHLMYPPGQRRPTRWNNIVLFDELFVHYGQNARRFGKLKLAELPSTPPPRLGQYLVLVSGVREYPEGIYGVEQLDIDSKSPELFSPKPKPRQRLHADAIAEQMAEVNAIAVGRNRLPKNLPADILAQFEVVEKWDGDQLYLRKRPATPSADSDATAGDDQADDDSDD
ncbi:MAG: hypothetical protein K0R38_1299 [Polyangiaceae bacterium]|jgi:hypothetical protein|nr:hypothetical protein [Polyangiaceae bacterium]